MDNGSVRDPWDWSALFNAFNTRFLVGLSLSVNYALGGLEPFGYHVFNVLVHIFNAILVYALAVLTFETPVLKGSISAKNRYLIGFFAGLLFLVHPIQTQAVDYIWQRGTSMTAFFYLASLVLYSKARMGRSKICYCLSFLATLAGMFSKENMVTGPLSLALYEFSFFLPAEALQKRLARLAPFLFLCVIPPLLLARGEEVTLDLMRPIVEAGPQKSFFGMDTLTRGRSESTMPRAEFLLTEVNVLRTYFRLLFLPLNQNLDYDYPLSRSFLELKTFFSFLGSFSILAAAVYFFKKNRFLSFCIFWFFLSLSVELLVPQADVLMEHRLYLSMAAFTLFLTAALTGFFKNNQKAAVFILVFAAGVFSILTYQRNFVWKSEFTLWSDAIQKSPKKARPYNNRGLASKKEGNLDAALADFTRALELDPAYSDAYNNRGLIYKDRGEPGRAIEDYGRAISADAKFAPAYMNRGVAYKLMNDLEKAMEDYNRALAVSPRLAEAYYNRANLYRQLPGEADKALGDYSRALELDPGLGDAYNNRAVLYFLRQDYDRSWKDVRRAQKLGLKIQPVFLRDLKRRSREL